MKRIKLKEKDVKFFIEHLTNEDIRQYLYKSLDDDHVRVKNKYSTGNYDVELHDLNISILLDELSNLLVEIGLNADDEPNEMGLYIESLIDKINSVVRP